MLAGCLTIGVVAGPPRAELAHCPLRPQPALLSIQESAACSLRTPDPFEEGSIWQQDSERLWGVVCASETQPLRAQCLLELAARHDQRLPFYLPEQLEKQLIPSPKMEEQWRDTLLYAAEQTQFVDPQQRRAVARLLLEHARTLRDRPVSAPQHPMWAALRRYATMIPAERVCDFLEFLRAQDTPLTKQAALQCIQRVFSIEPPPEGLDLRALREQVHALALRHLTPAHATTAEDRSLAVNAFRTALTLDDPEALELLNALVAMEMPHMLWLSRGPLQQLATSWERSANGRAHAVMVLERLRLSIARLNESNRAQLQGVTRGA